MAIWNDRIHDKRLEKNITLAQIAEKLGVTEATAQRYERGGIKSIPYEHILAYGEILNVPPSYLMGWDSETKPDTFPTEIRAAARGMMDLSDDDKELAINMINSLRKKGREAKNS